MLEIYKVSPTILLANSDFDRNLSSKERVALQAIGNKTGDVSTLPGLVIRLL